MTPAGGAVPARDGALLRSLLFAAAAVSALAVVAVFAFLLWFALPVFRGDALASLLSSLSKLYEKSHSSDRYLHNRRPALMCSASDISLR